MSVTMETSGSWKNTEEMLKNIKKRRYLSICYDYAQKGLDALVAATPVRTGLTRDSWSYEVDIGKKQVEISFHNSNIQNGSNIAIVCNYGHAGANGHWIAGRDYIDPAIQPIFDELAEKLWKEVNG